MRTFWEPMRIGIFRRLLGAYAVNALGNWLGQIALSVLVLDRTHSAAAVAAVMIAGQFAPSLLAPAVVTRLELVRRWPVLPCLLVGESLIFACLAGLCHTGTLVILLALIGADGLLGIAARSLLKASIAGVTEPRGLLREGNGVLTFVFTLCMAIGPVGAGLTIGLASPRVALAVDAASFLLAAAILLGRSSFAPARRSSQVESAPGRVREAIVYVARNHELGTLLTAYALLSLASAAILPLEVVLTTRTLHAGPAAFGTVLALWGIGATAGSALLARLRHLPLTELVAGSFVLMAVAYTGMGAAPTVQVVCLFSFIGGVGNGIEGFATITAIQERTGELFQVRVTSLFESITAATCGLGFLTGAALAVLSSPRTVYIASGIAILTITPLILKAPRYPQPATLQGLT